MFISGELEVALGARFGFVASLGFALASTMQPLAAQAVTGVRADLPSSTAEMRDGSVRPIELPAAGVRALSELGAVALRFEGLTVPRDVPPASRAEIVLRNGDRFGADIRDGRGDRLEVELAPGSRLALDIDRLASISFPARVPRAWRGNLEHATSGDRLYWVRGEAVDRVDGTLDGFETDGVRFEGVLGARRFPWTEIAGLFIEALPGEAGATPDATPESETGRVAVELADGGRLRAHLERIDPAGIALDLGREGRLTLPIASVQEVAVEDGSYVFLSDLDPARALEGWPPADGVGLQWPWKRDRAVTGDPLRAGGTTWSRGLGVHAPSRLEFEVPPGLTELRGRVAIDDSALLLAYHGSVEFSIHLGDAAEPAWRSGRVRGGDPVLDVPPLALGGATRIALQVDMDERSYVGDRADWLRLVLVRR